MPVPFSFAIHEERSLSNASVFLLKKQKKYICRGLFFSVLSLSINFDYTWKVLETLRGRIIIIFVVYNIIRPRQKDRGTRRGIIG